MTARRKAQRGATAIVIRRESELEGQGHHGGAWKVAYADFVTAMMAFFLLMWLINATTEKQRRGLADYFSPLGPTTKAMSGSGKPFGGLTPYEDGALVSNRGAVSVVDAVGEIRPQDPTTDATDPDEDQDHSPAPVVKPQTVTGAINQTGAAQPNGAAMPGPPTPLDKAKTGSTEPARPSTPDREAVSTAARELGGLLQGGALKDYGDQLVVKASADTLRVQISDSDKHAMFLPGSAQLDRRMAVMLANIAPIVARLGLPVSITGHTDSLPCAANCVSNWSLSAARADVTRSLLQAHGLPNGAVESVTGVADHEPLAGSNPDAPENRRVVLVFTARNPQQPVR